MSFLSQDCLMRLSCSKRVPPQPPAAWLSCRLAPGPPPGEEMEKGFDSVRAGGAARFATCLAKQKPRVMGKGWVELET